MTGASDRSLWRRPGDEHLEAGAVGQQMDRILIDALSPERDFLVFKVGEGRSEASAKVEMCRTFWKRACTSRHLFFLSPATPQIAS